MESLGVRPMDIIAVLGELVKDCIGNARGQFARVGGPDPGIAHAVRHRARVAQTFEWRTTRISALRV